MAIGAKGGIDDDHGQRSHGDQICDFPLFVSETKSQSINNQPENQPTITTVEQIVCWNEPTWLLGCSWSF